jgi:hypothetical protein
MKERDTKKNVEICITFPPPTPPPPEQKQKKEITYALYFTVYLSKMQKFIAATIQK